MKARFGMTAFRKGAAAGLNVKLSMLSLAALLTLFLAIAQYGSGAGVIPALAPTDPKATVAKLEPLVEQPEMRGGSPRERDDAVCGEKRELLKKNAKRKES